MQVISIESVPNQEFTTTLGNNDFRIQLRTIQDLTYMSCWVNGDAIFHNQICTPNNWVSQYKYLSYGGRFFFRCLEDNYPNYNQFNITQWLFFLTTEEAEQYDSQTT